MARQGGHRLVTTEANVSASSDGQQGKTSGCAFRRSRWTLPLRIVAAMFAFVVLAGGGVAAFLSWELSKGPVSFDFLTHEIAATLERRFGDGFNVAIRDARLSRDSEGLNLTVEGISVRDAAGNLVIAAPRAIVAFDGNSLLELTVAPRQVDFVGLSVALTIFPDGNVSVSAVPVEPNAADHGATDKASRATPETKLPEVTAAAPNGVADQVPLKFASFVDAVASPSGPLAILERAGLRDGLLRIDDQRNGRVVTYRDANVMFTSPSATQRTLAVRANGPYGRWGFTATVSGSPGEDRRATLSVKDLAVSELLGFAEKGTMPVATDMPISFDLAVMLSPDGALKDLDGHITGGSAVLKIDDPDVKPVSIDSVRADFSLGPDGKSLSVATLDVRGGAMRWKLRGEVGIPQSPSDGWAFSFRGDDSALALEDLKQQAIKISRLSLEGAIMPGFVGLNINKLEVRGPEVEIDLKASIGHTLDFDGLRLNIGAARMPAKAILAFWPVFVVPDIRSYFVEQLDGGRVERFDYRIRMTPNELLDAMADRPIPDDALRISIAVKDGAIRPAPGLPAITDGVAEGLVTGRTAAITFSKATARMPGGKTLALSDGTYTVADTAAHPAFAQITFRMKGTAEALATALRSEQLQNFSGPSFDPALVRGQFDGRASVHLPLVPVPAPQDIGVEATGSFANLSIDKVHGKEKLENATLNFTFGASGLVVKGEGRVGGVPAVIDMKQKAGATEPDLNVALTLDDAARQRRGLKTTGQMSGPVLIKFVSGPGNGQKPGSAQFDVDFTKAAITGLLPTWAKPAGKAAKASFRLNTVGEDALEFRDFVLDGGTGLSLKGEGELNGDGALVAARLASVRLSPGDDFKADIERQAAGYKLNVRAVTLDGRPFLKSAFGTTGQPASSGAAALVAPMSDLDIDLKAGAITGFAGETLSNVDLRLVTKGAETKDFRLAGRLSRATVSGQMSRTETGGSALVIESADAGGFFRFVDLYRRMVGGAMLLQVSGIGDPVDGLLVVNNFSLRNDPALSGVSKTPDNKTGRVLVGDASNVPFNKLRAQFAMGNGVLTLADATMWGPAVGGTLEGTMDFNRDRADLTGTFVPAYGLNNVLNKVPIVGTILLGGPNEGLFAVNFRVTGPPSNPVVSYNPLSAVAPGIFRKLFGVGRSDGDTTGAPAGQTPQAKPQPRAEDTPPSGNR